MATQTPAYVDAGLRSLRWLMTQQTTPAGHFRPDRHRGFRRTAATSPRLRSAARGSRRDDRGLPRGVARGRRCRVEEPSQRALFAWFLGSNDLSLPLVDLAHRQLPRWTASRSRQRESRWRVGRVLSSRPCGDSPACTRQTTGLTKPALHRAPLVAPEFTTYSKRAERHLVTSQSFLNRQALYLRPDPARVIVRPFKPATEPRDLNPTDKTRANHIVDRVLALDPETVGQPAGRCPGEFRGPASQPAGDVRGARRRNGRGPCGACTSSPRPAPADRSLFSQRIFVRSLGPVQPQHRAAPRPVGRAGRRPALHSQPPRRRRRACVVTDVSVGIDRSRRQRDRRSDGTSCLESRGLPSDIRARMAIMSR